MKKIQVALYIIALSFFLWCVIVGGFQTFYGGLKTDTFWVAVTSVIVMLLMRWSWIDER